MSDTLGRVSKNELCSSCRQIRMMPDCTIADMLDSEGYRHDLFRRSMAHHSILSFLEDDGKGGRGCSGCINLVKRAMSSISNWANS